MKKNKAIQFAFLILSIILIFAIGVMFDSITATPGISLAFALTGYVKSCGKKSSGVKSLYLNESLNLTAHTLDDTDKRDYTAVTFAAGKGFKKYDFDQDQCGFRETTTFENGSFQNTIEIVFRLGKMSPEISTAIMEMVDASYCGMEGVVVDNSGNKWYVGYNEEQQNERPLRLSGSEGTTGLALTDESGDTVTLQCITTEKAYTYSGEIDALITG